MQLRLVKLTTTLRDQHAIIDGKNALFGAVAAMDALVLLTDDRELVENIGHGVGQNSASYKGRLHSAFLPERMPQTSAHSAFWRITASLLSSRKMPV